MGQVQPWMRLKVKGDTYFLRDPDGGGVYFRNNEGSFHLQGGRIDLWVERLIPLLDGNRTLQDLTDGLPRQHRDRVYELADVLHHNGFLRDVSQDRPHRLPEELLRTYASSIEFLDHFGQSGGFRFQTFRESKGLVIGCGSFLTALVAKLLASGLQTVRFLCTDGEPTDRQRLTDLLANARPRDGELSLEEITLPPEQAVPTADWVLCAAQERHLEDLRFFHTICRDACKPFLPVWLYRDTGLVGPFVRPDSTACWESARRRLHRAFLEKGSLSATSVTEETLLANLAVFEMFKAVSLPEFPWGQRIYLLNRETLEGDWRAFVPHPLANGSALPRPARIAAPEQLPAAEEAPREEMLSFFHLLTSEETGIFCCWDEGELKQLPLTQCRVQAVDPLSPGPADVLPEVVCTGLTHEEARREAGLAGIEAYVGRLAESLSLDATDATGVAGIGAGGTLAEALARGLQHCLQIELAKRHQSESPELTPIETEALEDERIRYMWHALTALSTDRPQIGSGSDVFGFPTIWVKRDGNWYVGVGFNPTLALRHALEQALQENSPSPPCTPTVKKGTRSLTISPFSEANRKALLQDALQTLHRQGLRVEVYDLALEPFLREGLAGVLGVTVRKEEGK